jgi:4-amino-4-deoxy-L-arabinose transferase-like glycosyltransferase
VAVTLDRKVRVDLPSIGTSGSHVRPAIVAGIVAGLAVVLTLDDPGLTVDEPLDVRPGRTYVATCRAVGWRFFDGDVVARVFADNAEHPPLGRWLLGVASSLFEPFQIMFKGPDPTGLYVVSARLAPALSFAVLVAVVVAESSRRWGRVAGISAGWSLLVMPRVFAHAHLAALDTFLSLFWTLALLAGARAFKAPGRLPSAIGAGAFWSLALLTKIHAWLLLPVLTAWAFALLPWRIAARNLAAWSLTGITVFIAGWPWLWYDTLARFHAYLSTSVHRTTINVEYFGQVLTDRDVPWHYPWVYFALTVPVGLQILGVIGLASSRPKCSGDRFAWLLAATIGGFLLLFSTRVPVYDGERLFLHVFPAWAMLIGLGFSRLWQRWAKNYAACLVLAGFLVAQGYGVLAIHPFGLSYYNLLTGGLAGAEKLGLELTFWSDAVDRVLLDRLAAEAHPGARAALAPTLYPGQGILTTTAALVRREVILGDDDAAGSAEWLLLSRRRAYWKPAVIARLQSPEGRCVLTRSRQGVWLSALWHFPASEPGKPAWELDGKGPNPAGPSSLADSSAPVKFGERKVGGDH